MLACARLGVMHSVVFAGYSAPALRARIEDAKAKLVITTDGQYRRGKAVSLKEAVDEAVRPGRTQEVRRARAGGAPHRHRRPVDRRPRPVVARHRRERLTRAHPRSLRRRAATVFALHLGHHRCAEGHRAHHRWLPHPGVVHAPQHLRRQAGNRRVLVHRRHRLGHRAHLHRLRAAVQRGDPGALRGHPRLAQRAPPFRGDRKVRRHNLLHRADADPHVHEVGPRDPRRPRPVQPAAAGHRRRKHQPRGVAVVPGRDRRQPNARSSTPGGRPRPERR